MLLEKDDLKDLLEVKYRQYNNTEFIENDPIIIPHFFKRKEDIEISAFLTATISWGQRATIIKNAKKLMEIMQDSPYDFVMNAKKNDLKPLSNFVHRTFNGEDTMYFILALKNIYKNHNGLEALFKLKSPDANIIHSMANFRKVFFEVKHPSRSQKHVSDPISGSSAKRICMYLRWMVRKDFAGVDFGIWKSISPSKLYLPLDIHTGNVSRKLGLLKRKQNDWKSVTEITEILRTFDPLDPIKYDFALFGLGVSRELD
jgi:uncharacterized protein (TIGR02757 family)